MEYIYKTENTCSSEIKLDIEEKCKGITCGRRPTSCADQLALAVRKAFEESNCP